MQINVEARYFPPKTNIFFIDQPRCRYICQLGFFSKR